MLFNTSKFFVAAVCAGMLMVPTSSGAINTAPYSIEAANGVFKAAGTLGFAASLIRLISNVSDGFEEVSSIGAWGWGAKHLFIRGKVRIGPLETYTSLAYDLSLKLIQDLALTAAAAYVAGALFELMLREPKQSAKNHCYVTVGSE